VCGRNLQCRRLHRLCFVDRRLSRQRHSIDGNVSHLLVFACERDYFVNRTMSKVPSPIMQATAHSNTTTARVVNMYSRCLWSITHVCRLRIRKQHLQWCVFCFVFALIVDLFADNVDIFNANSADGKAVFSFFFCPSASVCGAISRTVAQGCIDNIVNNVKVETTNDDCCDTSAYSCSAKTITYS
jgi:hypothetical protein